MTATLEQLRTNHGVTVTMPGRHTATVWTDTTADAEVIADMLRHAGCQAALIQPPAVDDPEKARAWRRAAGLA